jgi:CheY-like chemotaxis protein
MTKKLLVADDSITIQKVVNLTFAGEDVLIEAVSTGDEAVEKARIMKPDVVLADVFMPGRNGYEVCASIKNDPELAGTPVVLLVGTFEPFDEAEAARVKCDGSLTKPFDTSELIEMVRSLAERKQKPVEVGSPPDAAAETPAAAAAASSPNADTLVSSRAKESFLGPGRILDIFDTGLLASLETDAGEPVEEEAAAPPEPASAPPPPTVEAEGEAKSRPSTAPQVIPFPAGRPSGDATSGVELPDELVNIVVDRVLQRMSPDVIREVAWEVVPELAEIIIRQILTEKGIPSKE